MRTTVILPDDLYRDVRRAAAEDGRTMTSLMEEALRQALHLREEARRPEGSRYRIRPLHGNGLRPGSDLDDSATLADLMDET